jgi:hypothetical protein
MWYLRSNTYFSNHRITEGILYSVYTILEYSAFAYYLHECIVSKKFKRFIVFSSFIFVLIALHNIYVLVSNKGAEVVDSVPIATSAILLLIFSIYYFYEEIQSPKTSFIYGRPSFWIVIGIMIYFSGTFFLFLQFSDLSKSDRINFWIINLACIILKNMFFCIAFLLNPSASEPENIESHYA